MMYHWSEKPRDPNEYNRNIHEPELKVRQPVEYTSTEPSHASLPEAEPRPKPVPKSVPAPPLESTTPPHESSPDSAHESLKPPSKSSKPPSKSSKPASKSTKKSKQKHQSSPDSTQESEPHPKPKPPSKSKQSKKSHKHHDSSSDSSSEPKKSKQPRRKSLPESEAPSKSSRPPKSMQEEKIPPPLFGDNGEIIPRPTDPETGDPLPVYVKKDGKAILKNGKPLTIKFFSDGKAMPFEKAYPEYPTKGQQKTQNLNRVVYANDTDDGGCCCCGGGNVRKRYDVSRRDSLDGRVNVKTGAVKVKNAPTTTTTVYTTYPQQGYGGYGTGVYYGYPYYGYGDAALMGYAAGSMLGGYGWGLGGGFYDLFW